jgi:hypothetical protein
MPALRLKACRANVKEKIVNAMNENTNQTPEQQSLEDAQLEDVAGGRGRIYRIKCCKGCLTEINGDVTRCPKCGKTEFILL